MQTTWVCLMYHDVTIASPRSSGGPTHFAVSRQCFDEHLTLLANAGFSGVSLAEAIAVPRPGQVAISFDDGDYGQFEHGFKELVARGMRATFFITTEWVGRPGYVTWEDLREMRAAGMSIQSHTATHPFLSEADEQRLMDELRNSKAALDDALEQDTDMLALPGGDFPKPSLRRLFLQAGYRVIATSRWGTNSVAPIQAGQLRYIRRCTVRGELDPTSFLRIAAGDPRLGMRRTLRDGALAAVRRALGRSRYARWRRRLLDAASSDRELRNRSYDG